MDTAAVVYVHGLWMRGAEAVRLRQRLGRERGYRLHVFRYRSGHQTMAQIAAALSAAIARIEAPRVHLLGHSLGGSVILHSLEHHGMTQPGRVVLLGAPVMGSRAARRLGSGWLGRRLLGQAAAEELLAPQVRHWNSPRELGIIAGTLPLGLGQLLIRFDGANDGTVAVSETRLPGATAHISVPATHMSLLWSAQAAREIGSFLEHGRFGC